MNDEIIAQAERALTALDPILGKLIASQTLIRRPQKGGDYFASLCHSIIGQQVSVAAARAISQRFETITKLQPSLVATLSDEDCKTIGLSRQKAGYLRDLGAHFSDDPLIYDHLDSLSDNDVIAELIRVKGIGVWTAQMFLMFTLARLDIFAPDDVGLQHGMLRLYGWETLPPKRELAARAEAWAPYRSIASLHLWQSLDNTPAS